MPIACIPPFTSVCVLLFTGAVVVMVALRAGIPQEKGSNVTVRPARFWLWAVLYMLFVAGLVCGILGFGLWLGIVNFY